MEALWRYRTLKSDASLFRHEYISVFKKQLFWTDGREELYD